MDFLFNHVDSHKQAKLPYRLAEGPIQLNSFHRTGAYTKAVLAPELVVGLISLGSHPYSLGLPPFDLTPQVG